jgi:hypothetical protein
MRVTGCITELKSNEVFVFGSNQAGIHGAGAARQALGFGAVLGQGYGHHGQTFAIPTKTNRLITLPIYMIEQYVDGFIYYAQKHLELNFLVTEIGCGLAGYNVNTIAPLFEECLDMENVWLPERFIDVLLLKSK